MPPKPKSTISDDLVEALLDTKVVEALAKALSPFIALSVDEAIGKRLEGLVTSVRELKGEVTRLHKQCDETAKVNEGLQKKLLEQERRIDDLECYSRSDNLVIRGLPEQSSAERASGGAALDSRPSELESHTAVECTVVKFIKDSLGLEVSPQDISIAHRIKAGPKDSTRPVIVRFTTRKIRNSVYRAKSQLKNSTTRIYISEHLTKGTSDLFFEARKLVREKKLFAAWTQNGLVHVKFSSDSSARAAVVRCRSDMNPRP